MSGRFSAGDRESPPGRETAAPTSVPHSLAVACAHGRVQPMVALGKALQAAGKPVMVVALRNFAPLVEAAGLSSMPIDRSLDESLAGVSWLAVCQPASDDRG